MGSGSSSTSNAWASAVLPRETGRDTRIMCWAGRALRWRGAAEEGLLARPERPSRCTLPITALRVTFPSSGNLAGGKAGFPQLLQLLDAIVGPGHYRHRTLPSLSRRRLAR